MKSLSETRDEIGAVVLSYANETSAYLAWRIYVKEKLDNQFSGDVPWEFCTELMKIYWQNTVLRAVYREYVAQGATPNLIPGLPV